MYPTAACFASKIFYWGGNYLLAIVLYGCILSLSVGHHERTHSYDTQSSNRSRQAKAVNSPRWLRAIERAAAGLQSGELIVTLLHDGALVTSANGSYHVNGHCQCEAARRGHRECYHRAAVRLTEMLETESEPVATKPATRDAIIADIKAAWPKSWPPLADELMARFRKNQLEMLSIDFLMAIRAVIA